MPMTRELKKRFLSVEDRIEKLEKRKPTPRTNGQDPLLTAEGDTQERLDNIEAVLQIPGEKTGDTQILSAWRQVVETILKKLEDRILQVELRASWTVDEGRELETRVRDLQTRDRHLTQEMNDNRPVIKKLGERVNLLEVKPVAGALSNIAQDMNLSIEGNTRDMKELKARNSLVHLLLLAVIILLFGISILT